MPDDHPGRRLDVAQAADYLGVSTHYIRRQVQLRGLPFYKVGRLLRFDSEELDRWLAARHHEAV